MMWPVQPYFRDAVGGDVPAITSIVRSSAPHDPDLQRTSVEDVRRLLQSVDRQDGGYLLVAEYDGQIVAVTQLLVASSLTFGGGRVAEILGLLVAPAFATSGVDRLLLDHALARADDLGCRRVQVMASGARGRQRALWEQSGFVHLDAGFVRGVRPATAERALQRIG
jgi:GNAT superfamily N-acetyltransferase